MCIIGPTSLCRGCTNITTSKKPLNRLVNTLLNLPKTCAEKFNIAVVQKRVDTLKFHWNYVHYWPYKIMQRVHNITISKKQLYRHVNTLLNLPQTCAEMFNFAVVQKRVDTLKFHWNYVHYWPYKFVQRVHNITTSKKQLYRHVNTLLNLPQTCAEKFNFAVIQKRVDTMKFHWNYVHYWPYKFVQRMHNIHNKQKTTLQACNSGLHDFCVFFLFFFVFCFFKCWKGRWKLYQRFYRHIQLPTNHFWGCVGVILEIKPTCRPPIGSKCRNFPVLHIVFWKCVILQLFWPNLLLILKAWFRACFEWFSGSFYMSGDAYLKDRPTELACMPIWFVPSGVKFL